MDAAIWVLLTLVLIVVVVIGVLVAVGIARGPSVMPKPGDRMAQFLGEGSRKPEPQDD